MDIRKKKEHSLVRNKINDKINTLPTNMGKVRQTLTERRQKAGIDRSYPLVPLKFKYSSEANVADNKLQDTRHKISESLKEVQSNIFATLTSSQTETLINKPTIRTTMSKPSTRPSPSGRPSAKQSARSGVVRDDLAECNFCGRRFATDRIQKHEEVCSKTGKKKRKAYDAAKHRVMGTELESYVLKPGGKKSMLSGKSNSKPTVKKDWRKTHEEFIAAIRAAKEAQVHLAKGGKLSDLPPPPPSSNPDYIQCPHCGRRFNEAAAERHIPKCASYQFNKPKPGSDLNKIKSSKK